MIPLRWAFREPPLEPCAVAACDEACAALIQRLTRCDDEHLARLRGVRGAGIIVVLGAAADLPWVEAATWLGADLDAPNLLVPTTLRPDLPRSWLARRIEVLSGSGGAVALLPAGWVVPLHTARPVHRSRLTTGRP